MKRLAEKLGWPGLLGIVLIVASLLFGLAEIMPLLQKISRLHLEQERQIPPRPITEAIQPGTKRYALEAIPGLIGQISELAARHGIQLKQTRSQLETTQADRRMLIRLPAQATYPALRQFIRQLPEQIPGAWFEEIALSRSRADQPVVDADLRIALPLLRST